MASQLRELRGSGRYLMSRSCAHQQGTVGIVLRALALSLSFCISMPLSPLCHSLSLFLCFCLCFTLSPSLLFPLSHPPSLSSFSYILGCSEVSSWPYCVLSTRAGTLPYHTCRNIGAKWLWAGTSDTVIQIKRFLLANWLSKMLCHSDRKRINTLSLTQRLNTVVCDNMDKPWGYWAEWTKRGTEEQILHQATNLTCVKYSDS